MLIIVLGASAWFGEPAALWAQDAPRVLVNDDFADPLLGVMPRQSSSPERTELGHVEGEYSVRSRVPDAEALAVSPGTYKHITLAVDARLLSDPATTTIVLGCRGFVRRVDRTDGYFAVFEPAARRVRLIRREGDSTAELNTRADVAALRPGHESKRLELTCSGTTLRAIVNGETVVEAVDNALREGSLVLGTGASGATVAEARFDNMLLTESPPSSPEPAPGTVGTPRIDASLAQPFEALLSSIQLDQPAVTTGYADGEYFIRRGAGGTGGFAMIVSGPEADLTNVSIAVDARINGLGMDRWIYLLCRSSPDPAGSTGLNSTTDGYLFLVQPLTRHYRLVRLESPAPGMVVAITLRIGYSSDVRAGGFNRLELSCAGDTITGRVNNVTIAAVEDTTYRGGRFGIGASVTQPNLPVEARFKNLRVTGE
jgi:hypothetical protein